MRVTPVEPAKPPVAPVDETPTPPAAPGTVVITLVGAPDGAEVKIGSKLIGVAPTVVVDRSMSQTVLTVFAEGYAAKGFPMTPDRDQELQVELKKKSKATGARAPGKDEIIHNVPGLTQ